jgi:hypothetical protein
MGEIKWDGDARNTVRCEPFVGNPKMWPETEMLGLELLLELIDTSRKKRTVDGHVETAHGEIEQSVIGPGYPRRLALTWVRRFPSLRRRCQHSSPIPLYIY